MLIEPNDIYRCTKMFFRSQFESQIRTPWRRILKISHLYCNRIHICEERWRAFIYLGIDDRSPVLLCWRVYLDATEYWVVIISALLIYITPLNFTGSVEPQEILNSKPHFPEYASWAPKSSCSDCTILFQLLFDLKESLLSCVWDNDCGCSFCSLQWKSANRQSRISVFLNSAGRFERGPESTAGSRLKAMMISHLSMRWWSSGKNAVIFAQI